MDMHTKKHLFYERVVKHPLNQANSTTYKKVEQKKAEVGNLKKSTVKGDFVDPLQAESYQSSPHSGDEEDIEDFCTFTKDDGFLRQFYLPPNDAREIEIDVPSTLSSFLPARKSNRNDSTELLSSEARLEWLENRNNPQAISSSGQSLDRQGVLTFFENCSRQLSKWWSDDQRVEVVKLSIQMSNMLMPTSTIDRQSYQFLFLQATSLLNRFGDLVHDRLVSKCPLIKVQFKHEDISPLAKDLWTNWLYKIASIRGTCFTSK